MKKLLFITAIIFTCSSTRANNIKITNVSVVPANNTIKFDVSWDNGWRSNTLNNWDAAWVFFKYYDPYYLGGSWRTLRQTGVNNIIPSGYASFITPNVLKVGSFIYRSAVGAGTTTLTNVELGITAAQATGIYDIKAFAVEMVYVPRASFFVGDGGATNAFITTQVLDGFTSIIDPITTSGPGAPDEFAIYPNGYYSFYCMKYELSQGGYRDFLNTLTYNQQIPHIAIAPNAAVGSYALSNSFRNNIKIKTAGISTTTPAVFGCDADLDGIYDETTDGEYIACNFLNWVDHAAYLDWAVLRPLTEQEFEKAARGIQLPINGEFVWGNTNIFIGPPYYSITNLNQTSEVIGNASVSPFGNANYNSSYAGTGGPLRNGIFATATSDRIQSGASFYGIMELSGNLYERVVTSANILGRNFDSSYVGDGELTNAITGYGYASILRWPGGFNIATGSYTGIINGTHNAIGLIYRGGGWQSDPARLKTSDRGEPLISNTNTIRANDVGVRGCLSVP
jgi:formylglycine-generating enzyme required for sulfatase activity